MINKILIAVDGSDASLKGARYGLSLAQDVKATPTLLLVVPPFAMPGAAGLAPLEDVEEAELARARTVLQAAVDRLEVQAVDTRVRLGPPAESIAELAAAEKYDVIVVGSTGKGAVKRLLVGSTADRLVHISQVPVLVVK